MYPSSTLNPAPPLPPRFFNGHIGKEASNYSLVHGGFGYDVRNESKDTLLEFALAKELVIANSIFKDTLALLYGIKCWLVKKNFEQKMDVTEMHMLRWICGHTMIDRIKNQDFREKLEVAPQSAKMREKRLRWFGHVQRKHMSPH